MHLAALAWTVLWVAYLFHLSMQTPSDLSICTTTVLLCDGTVESPTLAIGGSSMVRRWVGLAFQNRLLAGGVGVWDQSCINVDGRRGRRAGLACSWSSASRRCRAVVVVMGYGLWVMGELVETLFFFRSSDGLKPKRAVLSP